MAAALLLPCIFVLAPLMATLIGIGLGSVGRVWWGVLAGVVIGLWWERMWVTILLRTFRSAAWLEGVTLIVRGPYATRRCCLATASWLVIRSPRAWRADPALRAARPALTLRDPQLSATDSGTGRTVRLGLVDPETRRLLAPAKLRALADAIAAPSTPGQGSASAGQVAEMLRRLAAVGVP